MPIHESAKKRVRQDARKRVRNKGLKSRLTTQVRKFNEKLEAGEFDAAEEQLSVVQASYDKAWSKGVIPKNRAARKVGRLAKRLSEARAEG